MTTLVCSITTAIVALGGAWTLLTPRGAPITTVRTLRALATGIALTLIFGTACFAIDGRPFLSINVAYCATTIAAPIAGLLVLALCRRRLVSFGARAIALIALVPAPIGWYATFVAPWQLVTERVSIGLPAARVITRPITIAVLSDIQTAKVGTHERAAVQRALDANPDLVLLPGDLIQVEDDELKDMILAFHDLVARLHAPLGVYAVVGNCESVDTARQLLDGTPVRLLVNETVLVEHDGLRVRVCGVGLRTATAQVRDTLREFETLPGDDDVRIVLAHMPEAIDGLSPDSRVDLVVAGHTHGGQVQLPWVGPPLLLTGAPRAVAGGGLHQIDGRRVYVSRGIGWEHAGAPRVRFLCPPEVSVLTLLPR